MLRQQISRLYAGPSGFAPRLVRSFHTKPLGENLAYVRQLSRAASRQTERTTCSALPRSVALRPLRLGATQLRFNASLAAAEAAAPVGGTPDQNPRATALFEEVLANVQAYAEKHGKRLVFPKEILWLGGAPGAGKGTNTNFIMRERHLTAKPIVMSDLLDSPEARAAKAAGGMVGDLEVVQALLKVLIEDKYRSGVVVDGFPRTKIQADIVRRLYDTMMGQFRQDPAHNPRPLFRIVVLYVEQTESVTRQLKRGRQARAHNEKVRETGEGEYEPERDTDFDPALAKKRYQVFKDTTFDALEELGRHFTYNLINAQGDYDAVKENIKKEMEYQSRLELNPDTHSYIRDLPRASEIVMHARQALVSRLDHSARENTVSFRKAVAVLGTHFYPEIERHVISGKCYVTIPYEAVEPEMAIDILTDRGFRVTSERVGGNGPMRFEISWERPTIRRLFL